MASTSGTKSGMGSRRLNRAGTMLDPAVGEDDSSSISEKVPHTLESISPFLRVADEMEEKDRLIAYYCRYHAFEKAHSLDPNSNGRGVRQFKTRLLHILEKDKGIPISSKYVINFYKKFYLEHIKNGHLTNNPEKMAKMCQTASVLYDVYLALEPDKSPRDLDEAACKYAKDVEEKRKQYEQYNILPFYAFDVKPAIMELPEIKESLAAIRMPENKASSVNDILEWLGLTFGFQKANVANQREHLVLLLANMYIRDKSLHGNDYYFSNTVKKLNDKIFKNYNSWCKYLHLPSNIKSKQDGSKQQQRQQEQEQHLERQQQQFRDLVYVGLYLLIWGEASNIRFMPECLCYIFHCMSHEVEGLAGNVIDVTGASYETVHRGEESFLKDVVTPIYNVISMEAKRNKRGTASHSVWRNYDDLNEYFWSDKCFNLGWPMKKDADFFVHPYDDQGTNADRNNVATRKRKPKTNFVEIRTFWHLYRSFDRFWTFFILALQVMIIIAWNNSGSLSEIFDEDMFKSILSIFITAAILHFWRAVLDIILSLNAWRSMRFTQILRYLLKLVVAALWVVLLPITYSKSIQNPTGVVRFFNNLGGIIPNQSLYYYCVGIYLMPNILAAFLFMFPCMRKSMEKSNWRIVVLLMWWSQPKLYIGRGMHEDMISLFKYTFFWIFLLISKLAFSYYVEILPLVQPTKTIMNIRVPNYEWHEFFPNLANNIGVVVAIWSPVVLVYFLDTQIWYAIFYTIVGGITGAFSHLGEIRTLGMLRSRFVSIPSAFRERLVPHSKEEHGQVNGDDSLERKNIAKFSQMWNEFIVSMRMEDLINNRERDLLLVPYSSSIEIKVIQWPPFLLASKIPIAVGMVKDFKGIDDAELFRTIKNDEFMFSALIECFETLKGLLTEVVDTADDKRIIEQICDEVDNSIKEKNFLRRFNLKKLPLLNEKLEKFLDIIVNEYGVHGDETQRNPRLVNLLQDVIEAITQDIMVDGNKIMKGAPEKKKSEEKFQNINKKLFKTPWWEKVVRLHLLLTVKESAINVPMNLEARRRMTFFANSLFMKMPSAPEVRNMMSFSVLTPYYKEEVKYSMDELNKENEDGISTLFYLQKIYPDEWKNFQDRIDELPPKPGNERELEVIELTRQWVSNRGQTLSRTVRGMMYYRNAIELQYFLENVDDKEIFAGYRNAMDKNNPESRLNEVKKAWADLKFTYIVSCQLYGTQKKSLDAKEHNIYANILNLMLEYPSLRVAYIDEREETVGNTVNNKIYYSVLVKGGDKLDEEIYRIKLPGPPAEIGEGKPENQNHAIIFTRGEALQTIDMNQDNYYEEAFKMRNVLEEFTKTHHGQRRPTILGLREHIFTGSVSSLAWFMSNQETSFVTIGQRVMASPLRVRFHYGHPDIFDRIFHLTRGGISKASKTINLSEDIFSGYNSTLRGGYVTHHEYIQVGKGRDVGMNQISLFEAKVANGNGEQTLSRDVYRLGRRFDFYRMLSFYFTTIGFYFSSMVTVLTVYVFLYGRLYMVLSGLEKWILEDPSVSEAKALEEALATQSMFQLGLLLVFPMVMEIGLERGFLTAIGDFVVMQLQLASVFFTFQLGTKAHYYGRTLLHGGSKYRATGRGFVVFHAKYADNYRLYSRSHFVKGLELLILLVVYEVYGESYRSSKLYWFITVSMWFLVGSWLSAPFVFNPSGYDWQKTVDDWTDWKRWMGNRGGIGISADKSWESWWGEEQEHLKHTSIRGRLFEIILSLRFFIYQYGVVYHLDIAHGSRSVLVYGLSWFVMVTVLLVLKMVSMGRRRFGTDFQLMFRILKALLFLGFASVMTVLFVVCGLTVSDLFAALLAFLPTGWGLLLIGQACRPCLKRVGVWDSVMELGRAYECIMGLVIFLPTVILSWFPFVSEFQTRLLFNQAFSRGLQISMILAGRKDDMARK
ncbi:unnamed protein product [Cuscuta epithymum]|uniref:1,3-beta-glucan synthase n=1 Tax=Cuscuta epithymum TaxID=186058 RepID=A0AAV0DQE9_9ASTE|nr:unnamed protein product [Cuscuta epithymum]